MNGKAAVVKISKTLTDGTVVNVLMVEAVLGQRKITITDQDGAPISDAIRNAAETLIRLVQEENA